MAYLVKFEVEGKTRYEVVSRNFACLPSELPRELATTLRIRKSDIINISHYGTTEAAEIVAAAFNDSAKRTEEASLAGLNVETPSNA